MKDFYPEGDAILCEPVIDKYTTQFEFIYEPKDKLPIYKVLKIGSKELKPNIEPGDLIICNSIGNMFKNEGKIYHIFSYNNIIGKLK
jgi:hypothetical protein